MAKYLTSPRWLNRVWDLEMIVKNLIKEVPKDAVNLEVVVYIIDGLQKQTSEVIAGNRTLPVRFDFVTPENQLGKVVITYNLGDLGGAVLINITEFNSVNG